MRRFLFNRTTKTKWTRGRVILVVEIVGIAFVGLRLAQIWQRGHEVRTEIKELETQVAETQHANGQLQDLIAYLNSSAYVEEKARQDLGLQKPGEHVVVVATDPSFIASSTAAAVSGKREQQSNIAKWFAYFFDRG